MSHKYLIGKKVTNSYSYSIIMFVLKRTIACEHQQEDTPGGPFLLHLTSAKRITQEYPILVCVSTTMNYHLIRRANATVSDLSL